MKEVPKQKGHVPSGIIELWCFEELVRMKQFYSKYQRKEIMNTWLKDLTTGTHRGTYCFVIKLN